MKNKLLSSQSIIFIKKTFGEIINNGQFKPGGSNSDKN